MGIIAKVGAALQELLGKIALVSAEKSGVIQRKRKMLTKTCRRDKRTKPGTFELLNDIDLLDFTLT